jgi:PPOX class probable F420-dependent enzyme
MQAQKRGVKIAMTPDELNNFLVEERVCRVATLGPDGRPHVAPLWFAWDGSTMWLNSLVKSQRWTDLMRDPRVALVVDGGTEFYELHGVEITGKVEVVGDVPRTARPDPALVQPERLFARKYSGGDEFHADGRHGWLRVVPEKVVSWDFRKSPALRTASEAVR